MAGLSSWGCSGKALSLASVSTWMTLHLQARKPNWSHFISWVLPQLKRAEQSQTNFKCGTSQILFCPSCLRCACCTTENVQSLGFSTNPNAPRKMYHLWDFPQMLLPKCTDRCGAAGTGCRQRRKTSTAVILMKETSPGFSPWLRLCTSVGTAAASTPVSSPLDLWHLPDGDGTGTPRRVKE